jgi:hypothetical protein
LISVTWEAFMLRESESETALSGGLFESCSGSVSQRLKNVQACMTRGGMILAADAALAACNTELIRKCGRRRERKLRVRHEPKRLNSTYAALRGLPADNSDVALLESLAAETVKHLKLVKDL